MKVSVLQFAIKENEEKASLEHRVMSMVSSSAGSDLIVLPELWNIGALSYRTIEEHAEERTGHLMSLISEKARKLCAFIHCGSFVEKDGGNFYNTSILFDRNGTDVAVYRKIHLFSCYGHEADFFTHGEELSVTDTELGKIGLAICYDLRFPEIFRKMAFNMGAEIFIVPAAWPCPRTSAYSMLCSARAMENSAYLISSNLTGKYKHLTMPGLSSVNDPWGTDCLRMGGEEGILAAEISSDEVRKMRREFPVFDDVRML